MYHSPGAPEPGYGPGLKQWAARDFWEGNLGKQHFSVWLSSYCITQRLAWNKLRSFVSLKPQVWVGTTAAATQHLHKLRLVRWESTLLHCILPLHVHIFNLPRGSDCNFYPLTCSTRRRLQLANFPSPGWADTAFLKVQVPGMNILKNNLKKLTYHKQQNISLSTQESTSPKGFQRLIEPEIKHLFKSVSSICSFKPHNKRYQGELSDVDYQKQFSLFFQKQHHRLEKFHPPVSPGDRFSVGCRYLERDGVGSSTLRILFWVAFHFYSVHFLSNDATLKLEI